MSAVYDVAVIGAGPAGLAAATFAARYALWTVLFDEQAEPGGRRYGPPPADIPMRRSARPSRFRQCARRSVPPVGRNLGARCDGLVGRSGDDGLCEIGIAYGPPEARTFASFRRAR